MSTPSYQTGTPRVLLVHSTRRHWVHVYLPLRPNGSTGWVSANALKLLRNPFRIVVRLRAHRLDVWRGKSHRTVKVKLAPRPAKPPTG